MYVYSFQVKYCLLAMAEAANGFVEVPGTREQEEEGTKGGSDWEGQKVEELHIQEKDEARRLDFNEKISRLRKMMSDRGIHSALISTVHNFFWLTSGGRNYVSLNTDMGVASIFVDAGAYESSPRRPCCPLFTFK